MPYGYNIGTYLSRRRLGSVTGGTLYPVLKRLEADGLVTTRLRGAIRGRAGTTIA